MPTDVQSVTSVIPACGEDHTASPRDHLAAALHRLNAARDMVGVVPVLCDLSPGGDDAPAPAWVGSVLCMLIADAKNLMEAALLHLMDTIDVAPCGTSADLLAGVMDLAQRTGREGDLGGLSRHEALLAEHVVSLAIEQLSVFRAQVRA